MEAQRPLVSIVCPAFNEEASLPGFHRELAKALANRQDRYRFEIVYVDDGSADATPAILRALVLQDPRVRWLSLSRNFGHQAALTAGLERARGDAVVTMDSDLQHPPEVVSQLLDAWEAGYDVVLAIRADDPKLSWFKRWSSRQFYRIVRRLGHANLPEAAADFRLLTRKSLNALIGMREKSRFLRGMVHWLGFRTARIPFTPAPRHAGQSKYTLRKMFRLAGDGIFSFSVTPIRWVAGLGVACTAAGLVGGVAILTAVVLGGLSGSAGLLALVAVQLFLAGLILTGLGVVGEYVGRAYEQVKDRPIYVVADTSEDAPAVLPDREAA
jgi:dolichol-phosphate mannosyltransferase